MLEPQALRPGVMMMAGGWLGGYQRLKQNSRRGLQLWTPTLINSTLALCLNQLIPDTTSYLSLMRFRVPMIYISPLY